MFTSTYKSIGVCELMTKHRKSFIPCRPAICIFYLVLRALDTVEDDMNIPVEKKVAMLKEFHEHLYEEEWTFMESSEKDKAVLEEFPKVRYKV